MPESHAMERPILLVEDNPMDVDLTLRAFARRKLGNRVDVARDGEEALDLVARWDASQPLPAVILLDVNLPRVGGLDVLRAIRQDPRFAHVPVVMLTTSTEDQDIERAYALGANSYIVKPVSFESFVDAVTHINLYWVVLNTPPRPGPAPHPMPPP